MLTLRALEGKVCIAGVRRLGALELAASRARSTAVLALRRHRDGARSIAHHEVRLSGAVYAAQ
jgi:hypothetical protein